MDSCGSFLMATGREKYVWWEKKTEQRDFKYWRRAVKTEAGRQRVCWRELLFLWSDSAAWFIEHEPYMVTQCEKNEADRRGQRIMGNVSEGMKEGIRKQPWLAYLSVWKCRDLHADPLSKMKARWENEVQVRHHHETLYIWLNARNNSRSGSALARLLTVLGLCRLWLHLS